MSDTHEKANDSYIADLERELAQAQAAGEALAVKCRKAARRLAPSPGYGLTEEQIRSQQREAIILSCDILWDALAQWEALK